jgi:hypothetical protein
VAVGPPPVAPQKQASSREEQATETIVVASRRPLPPVEVLPIGLVLGGLTAFLLLLQPAGLVIATVACVVVAGLAARGRDLGRLIVLAVAAAAGPTSTPVVKLVDPATGATRARASSAMPTASSISLNPGRWWAIRFKPSNMAIEIMSAKPLTVEMFFTQSRVTKNFPSPLPS